MALAIVEADGLDRGKVLERGMPRFFRRFAEGVFDIADLKMRTDELARFIAAAAT